METFKILVIFHGKNRKSTSTSIPEYTSALYSNIHRKTNKRNQVKNGKQTANRRQVAYLISSISITIFNVNGINAPTKTQTGQVNGKRIHELNYTLSTRNSPQI